MQYYFFPGANAGIGKETALDLVKRVARLILLCQNADKAEKALPIPFNYLP